MDRSITIIAGPCSVDEQNLHEIREIAEITVQNRKGKSKRAIAGTRIVGLKSRTELDTDGAGMGMDYDVYRQNVQILMNGGGIRDLLVLPSALIAQDIHRATGMIIATEIMHPLVQLPSFEGRIPAGKFIPWNPAVDQLGWHIQQTAQFARRNGWHIGIKNGKWIGDHLEKADHPDYTGKTTMEKTWMGLVKYVQNIDHDIILIHRGVDVPGKGDFRNAVVHNLARRVKKTSGAKLYFDPSHSFGPKLRSHIMSGVVDAMKLRMDDHHFLYDGVLIEVGTSTTDTEQHITIAELRDLVAELARFRDLAAPVIH